jgi:hypothetical protein
LGEVLEADDMKFFPSLLFFLAFVAFRGIDQNQKTYFAQTDSSQAVQLSEYELWVQDYKNAPVRGALGENNQISFQISVIERDDKEPTKNSLPLSSGGGNRGVTRYGFALSTEGSVWTFHRGINMLGSGGEPLPKGDFEKVGHLIEALPDDHSQLPPKGRRLVLQLANGDTFLVRVYDRANLPEIVLEILRLCKSQIRPIVADFPPDKKFSSSEFEEAGIPENAAGFYISKNHEEFRTLAISPDGALTVKQVSHDTAGLTVIDSYSSAVIRRLREPQIPPSRRFIGFSSASFTPDGKYLMVLSSLPAIRIFDTNTWQPANILPELPADAVAYYPTADWRRGVFISRDGAVALWDSAMRRQITKLALDGDFVKVLFSPDNSQFAIVSTHQNADMSSIFHLRIWETESGELVNELRPFEQDAHDDIGDMVWWPDGKYLLAAIRDNPYGTNHDIGIWNVQTGRFRGGFSGCVYSSDPFSLVLHDQRLFERCRDGVILMWDARGALDRIAKPEDSVKAQQ